MEKNSVKQDENISITKKSAILKRLYSYVLPYWKEALLILVLMIFSMMVSLLNPKFIQYTIDNSIRNKDVLSLIKITVFMVVLNLIAAYASKVRLKRMGFMANKIVLNMREELYSHIQKWA